MKITAEQWVRYEASNSKKRKKSSLLRSIHEHVCRLREQRSERKLIKFLTATQRLRKIRLNREHEARWVAELESARNAEKLAREIRHTLLSAAREARSMGFKVRKSTGRTGHVSSYYAKRSCGQKAIRISDHELPLTDHREMMSNVHGGGSPFVGEIIIDKPMSITRLHRLLVLAEAGRS